MYNVSFLNESTSVYNLAAGVNDASGGWLMGLILVVFWILLFMVFDRFDSIKNFVAVNFIISGLGGFLLAADLIHWGFLLLPLIMLFIGLMVLIFGE